MHKSWAGLSRQQDQLLISNAMVTAEQLVSSLVRAVVKHIVVALPDVGDMRSDWVSPAAASGDKISRCLQKCKPDKITDLWC